MLWQEGLVWFCLAASPCSSLKKLLFYWFFFFFFEAAPFCLVAGGFALAGGMKAWFGLAWRQVLCSPLQKLLFYWFFFLFFEAAPFCLVAGGFGLARGRSTLSSSSSGMGTWLSVSRCKHNRKVR